MGFFNPFYYLKYLLRRFPKKILVLICIFLIICLCHLKGYCVDDVNSVNVPNADIVQLYKLEIDRNFAIVISRTLENYKQFGRIDGNIKNFFNLATSSNIYAIGCYSYNYSNLYFSKNNVYLNDSPAFITCVFVNKNNYYDEDTIVIPGIDNSNYSSSRSLSASKYSNATIVRVNSSGTAMYLGTGYDVVLIDAFRNYIPIEFYDIMKSLGDGTFDFTTTDEILNDISEKLDETNQQLEELNNFFNDNTTPTITTNDLPTDTMSDVTSSGLNGIFTKIYNKTTNSNVETISITIPYLNYTFTLNSNYLQQQLSNWGLFPNGASFVYVIHIIWAYFIYRYIVLDIYKYINDIKNGNISKTDTNIKADML